MNEKCHWYKGKEHTNRHRKRKGTITGNYGPITKSPLQHLTSYIIPKKNNKDKLLRLPGNLSH